MRWWPFRHRRLTLADCEQGPSGVLVLPATATTRDIAALAVEWTRLHHGTDRAAALRAAYQRYGVKS